MLGPIELGMTVTGGGMEVIWKVRVAARRGESVMASFMEDCVLANQSVEIMHSLQPFSDSRVYPFSQILDPNSSTPAQS